MYLKPIVDLVGEELLPHSLVYVDGAHRYGLSTPDSDDDFTVIYYHREDQRRIFRQFPDVKHDKSNDLKLYSLENFAGLLVKGNPNVVEIAAHSEFVPPPEEFYRNQMMSRRTIAEFMTSVRPHLVTLNLLDAYMGHLAGIRKEMRTKGITPKRLSHAMRMAHSATALMYTGNIPDFASLTEARNQTLEVKTGEIHLSVAESIFSELSAETERLYLGYRKIFVDNSNLRRVINDFFVSLE